MRVDFWHWPKQQGDLLYKIDRRGRGQVEKGMGWGSGKSFKSWHTGGQQPFKTSWKSAKPEGLKRRGLESPKEGDDSGDTGYCGGRIPWFAKLEFSSYNGKGNPIEWLQRCEFFFEEKQTPAEAWVRQATFSLQGKASAWYHNLRRMKTRLNWFEFSEECRIRFGPPMSMNPLGELTRLR